MKFPFSLDPQKPIVLLGSCFADNIAAKMRSCDWVAENPLGTLFNPSSVASALRLAINKDINGFAETLFRDKEIVHSRAFGTCFSASSENESITRFQTASERLIQLLDDAEALFVTFGTSYVYSLKDSDNQYIVGNCHKQHPALFNKSRLSPETIISDWSLMIESIQKLYRSLKIIFTVSPVRHLADGFHENTLSKAILHLAAEELTERFDNTYYFPAYEILTDDLRDYRFYASDLVHPSESGIEYIWEKLKDTMLDSKGIEILRQGEKRVKQANHIHNLKL